MTSFTYYMLCAVFIQITTAQVLTNVPRNIISGQDVIPNQLQHTVTNGNPILNTATNRIARTATNGVPNVQYLTNAQPVNEQAAIVTANQDYAANGNTENGVPNAHLAALAAANLANLNGNVATFNMGNGGFTVTSGSPGNQGFGIQVLADALEVGGQVAVNGQIPIFGAVTVNGHVPTGGSAAVNYNCGGQTPDVV